jgi:hypothetical protein
MKISKYNWGHESFNVKFLPIQDHIVQDIVTSHYIKQEQNIQIVSQKEFYKTFFQIQNEFSIMLLPQY